MVGKIFYYHTHDMIKAVTNYIILMSNRVTITLDDEAYEFLELKAKGNRSAYISNIIKEEKQRIIARKILKANQEEAEDSYQQQLKDWDTTLTDGL